MAGCQESSQSYIKLQKFDDINGLIYTASQNIDESGYHCIFYGLSFNQSA